MGTKAGLRLYWIKSNLPILLIDELQLHVLKEISLRCLKFLGVHGVLQETQRQYQKSLIVNQMQALTPCCFARDYQI